MKFQFVDNDSTSKPGSRKAIRSHVMKGKNLGRTIQGRGRKHAAPYEGDFFEGVQQVKQQMCNKDGGIADDAVLDQDGNALMFPEVTTVDAVNSFNNPFAGEEYTYFAFPVQFTPSMRYMVYECLHCLLAMVTTYLNMLRKPEIPDLESLEATRHFSQALRIMNPRLSQPSAAQNDPNVVIIISLAIHSIIMQDLSASVMHLEGLQRLLDFRPGGISGIRECNRALAHKICRTDIELAVAQGTRTRFSDAGLTAAAAGPVSARNLAYPLNQTSELLRQVTRELFALCRRPGRAKMAGLQYQDVLISMWQRIIDFAPLGGTRPQDLLDDVWQLALLAFLVTVTWSTSFLRNVHCKLLHKLLREHVESRALLARGDDYQALWFWVVFIYALSLPDDGSEKIPLKELREMGQKLDVRTWEDLRAKFKQFPWIGVVHDIPGKKLWELARLESASCK
ncbi:hypothetical protein ACHAPJ_006873 [Fusarium lateritium]